MCKVSGTRLHLYVLNFQCVRSVVVEWNLLVLTEPTYILTDFLFSRFTDFKGT